MLDGTVVLGDGVDEVPEAVQLTVGQVLFPLVMIVTPNVLPLPFGLPIIFWELGQVAATFQVELTLAGEGTFSVTVQSSDPETATLRLYRSFHL